MPADVALLGASLMRAKDSGAALCSLLAALSFWMSGRRVWPAASTARHQDCTLASLLQITHPESEQAENSF